MLPRDLITLEGLMLLIHYSAAVAGVEIKAFLSERSSPANLVPYKSLPMLRNSFTKEVIANDYKLPAMPETTCFTEWSREESFLSPDMEDLIPSEQLIVNPGLASTVNIGYSVSLRTGKKLTL